jgi:hypothetical protein
MTYARVGVYTLQHTPTTVACNPTEAMLPLFERQPGLVDNLIVTATGTLVSISTWSSAEQAHEGARQAAQFVLAHDGVLTLDHSYVGTMTLATRASTPAAPIAVADLQRKHGLSRAEPGPADRHGFGTTDPGRHPVW